MNRLCFQACGLGQPLRRPVLSVVRLTEVAHAQPSGNDHNPVPENRLQRLPLAGRENLALRRSHHVTALSKSISGRVEDWRRGP